MAQRKRTGKASQPSDAEKVTTEPADEKPQPGDATDYRRAGGHVLTERGWVLDKAE